MPPGLFGPVVRRAPPDRGDRGVNACRAAPSAEGCITGFSSGHPAFLMEAFKPLSARNTRDGRARWVFCRDKCPVDTPAIDHKTLTSSIVWSIGVEILPSF